MPECRGTRMAMMWERQTSGDEGLLGAGPAPLLRSRVAYVWNKVSLLLQAIIEFWRLCLLKEYKTNTA